MLDRREMNAKIFEDTEKMYKSHKVLKEAVAESIREQKLICDYEEVEVKPIAKINFTEEEYIECKKRMGAIAKIDDEEETDDVKIIVSGKRTLEAAESYAKQGKKVCILNFASATNPGGGVRNGSSAQEEAICRCSTLYPCLNTKQMWEGFYSPHRNAHNPLYNNDCIYTPNVKVFKSDINFPEAMPENEWWDVNVITCAAPNLREVPSNRMNPYAGDKKAEISLEDLRQLLRSRVERIFQVALANGADVLILGAFGCGAFRNPPRLVAEVFKEYTDRYGKFFDVIEYAVFHTEREKGNYEAFREVMEGK